MTMMRMYWGGSLVVIRSWMDWRPLAASWIQEEDMVGTSRGENWAKSGSTGWGRAVPRLLM